jgi:hypothetical protein
VDFDGILKYGRIRCCGDGRDVSDDLWVSPGGTFCSAYPLRCTGVTGDRRPRAAGCVVPRARTVHSARPDRVDPGPRPGHRGADGAELGSETRRILVTRDDAAPSVCQRILLALARVALITVGPLLPACAAEPDPTSRP